MLLKQAEEEAAAAGSDLESEEETKDPEQEIAST
jgi:hypothetical protein